MTSNLLSIGKSGLLAAQVGLSTTGHNITNANVDGYNRQVVLQQTAQFNNAGYGYLAAIEEGEEADIRALFEANLFGPLNLVKAVLPGMRARRCGHIANISSIAGHVSYPGIGYYNMVKFAIEGLSGALAKEVAPLGIGVTTVAPGAFRTGFRGPTSLRQSAKRIADYADTAGRAREGARASHGMQPGDPVRGARAIIAAIESERPPLHLLIGSDALNQLRNRLEALGQEAGDWEGVTRSTDLQTT